MSKTNTTVCFTVRTFTAVYSSMLEQLISKIFCHQTTAVSTCSRLRTVKNSDRAIPPCFKLTSIHLKYSLKSLPYLHSKMFTTTYKIGWNFRNYMSERYSFIK